MRTHHAALCIALLAAPATALAQTPAPGAAQIREARERFQRGVDLTDQQDYAAAMVEFQRAYEITHNPAVLFNISATHEALHHYVEALDAMRSYEQLAPAAVVAQRRADVDAALARLQNLIGVVQVTLDTPGLVVTVDGIVRRPEEVRAGLRVDAGRHRLGLSAPGFRAREEQLDVAGGRTVQVSAPLDANESSIAVESNVPGADVLVDGQRVATTPLESPVRVHEGRHHVEVTRAGYTPYATDVEAGGAGATVRATLAWADPLPEGVAAGLAIHADPDNAHAVIDGRRVGLQGERVPPGRHELRVERTDYLPVVQTVNLAPGRVNQFDVFLPPGPVARATEISFWRDVGIATAAVGLAVAIGGGIWFGYNQIQLNQNRSIYDAANTPQHMAQGALCDDPSGGAHQVLCAQIRGDYGSLVSQGETYQLASGAVLGAGGLIFAVGAVGVLGARLWDPGEQQPRFRVVAGLNSVGMLMTF